MDEQEIPKLTIEDTDGVSEEYNRLYAIYESIMDIDQGPVEDMAAILTIDNSNGVATYKAWDLFNIRGRQRSSSNIYAVSNYFNDDSERRAKEIFLSSLNNYIRKLEPMRYGYNKIATLYSYLIYAGLYGLMTEIYIPDYMKETVDGIINEVNNKLDNLIDDCRVYFEKYNNPKLNSIVKSLGRIILSQRSDQVFNTLKSYEDSLDENDWNFLATKRSEFLKFQNSPELTYAKNTFGLSEGSYYRNLNQIVQDLSNLLDEDSFELLTELFLKN